MINNLEISMIPALLLLPLLLRVASLHYLLGIIILTALPGLVLSYYYATHRRKRRTLFFLALALYSLAYMYYLFITEILPRGDVSPLQMCVVTTGMILTIVSLIHTKRGPGFVADSLHEARMDAEDHSNHSDGSIQLAAPEKTRKQAPTTKWTLCPVCKIMRPPRAGHCRTCGSSLCFTCCWYSSIITVGLVYLLVAQVLNISFNVTGREAQLALRNKKGQSRLWGLVVDTGEHSCGFYQNWVEFLTMKDSSVPFHSSPTDLV
ncbi:hypothetical protein GOODEAATRI_006002 [Goodea atripinnis]|uniref:Palmitoyltransferase n=1 Tax=Goodea atripinnis TaxID=208336 RepID=A0ABV0P1W0_9TELE